MLTHYIFVRRDLPVGVIAAQVTHAAAESAVLFDRQYDPYENATAVILEAHNEYHLLEVKDYLTNQDIEHIEIVESGGPYNSQFMALGLIPLGDDEESERVKPLLRHFQTLKSCLLDNPPSSGSS